MLSILHRLTGVALSLGTVLIVVWALSLAAGQSQYESLQAFVGHPLVSLALGAWTLALFYHLCNGIRHLLWDTGMLFDLNSARASGIAVVIAAVVLTAVVWGGLI